MIGSRTLLVAALAALAAPTSWAQDAVPAGAKAYHAARIYTGGQPAFVDDGYLIVADGKVVQVVSGEDALPPMIPVIDLGDAVLTPGLVAADSTFGSASGSADHALGAHRRAYDDFDPYADMSFVLSRGITTLYLTPERRRLVGGRGAVVKSAGENRVLRSDGDLRVSLEPEAFNPPRYFRPPIPPTSENPIVPAQRQPASSPAGALMALREAGKAARSQDEFDAHARALAEFLGKPAPLRVAASTTDEVAGAIEIASDWNKSLVVDGGADAWRLADDLARKQAAVIFDVPLFLSMPDLSADWEEPAADSLQRLRNAGVPIALSVGRFGRWTWLLEAAAASVSYGLDESNAMAGITRVPAQVLGVGDRVGRLDSGFDADFLVLTGLPLDPAARVERVFVDGDEVWDSSDWADEDSSAVVVRGGTLWTGDGAPITGGAEVLLENGKVVAAGSSVPHPPGARVVDAGEDAHITPGFIDSMGHLGVTGDTTVAPQALFAWLADTSAFDSNWRSVARAGVTSMVVAPRRSLNNGTRLHAAKTASDHPDLAYVAGHDLVYYNATGGDRSQKVNDLQRALRPGQGYFQKWEKYRADRKAWETEQAEKKAGERKDSEAALRERLAKGLEKKEEVKEEEDEEVEVEEEETEKAVDPLNGTWEGTIEDPRLPQPITVVAELIHEGERVTGVFSSPDDPSGSSVELEGTFKDNVVRFEFPTDFGSITITGEIDAPDHMNVKIELQGLGSAEFEVNRTSIAEEGAAVTTTKRRVKKAEGPQPPKIQYNLEGARALFEGRAVALVRAERADEITAAVKVFSEFELPLVIVGGSEAHQVSGLLHEHGVGVLVSPTLVSREEFRDIVPAARLRALGIPVAFRSGAATGSRYLPRALSMATRYGLGAQAALEGLTSEAADILGLSDSIGRLRPGLDGDVVVFDGPPFDLRSRVTQVFVNGKEVNQ